MLSVLIVLIGTLKEVCGLRVHNLEFDPEFACKGGDVLMRCLYDLGNEQLYCVKWYRGKYEFYRYCPYDRPPGKVYARAEFNVDLLKSNASQVALRDVGSHLNGLFTCEVSSDAPKFTTLSASSNLQIVHIPQGVPVIVCEHSVYEVGDVLRADCTAPPSLPRSNITMLINNEMINSSAIKVRLLGEGLYQNHLSINLILKPKHFSNGHLVLECVAQIENMYRKAAELILESKTGPPIWERVMYNKAAVIDLNYGVELLFLLVYHVLNNFLSKIRVR